MHRPQNALDSCTLNNLTEDTKKWAIKTSLDVDYLESFETLKGRYFQVELISMPQVLQQYSVFADSVQVSSITDQGITFYLSNASLVTSKAADVLTDSFVGHLVDGCLFVPMSNVLSINFFGNFQLK